LEDRLLVRTRQKFLSDIKRCKCRIKSQLNYFGIKVPVEFDNPYWSKGFRVWLREGHFKYNSGTIVLETLLDELEQIEIQKRKIEKEITILARTKYKDIVELLKSIPGIGLLGAITLVVEIADINRFKSNDQLHSFTGLIPNVYASGETEKVGKITKRHNAFLRPVLIQCAWRAAKADPSLSRCYMELCRKMKGNKAIIRIAKKLLNRVSFVWKTGCAYEILN
jgi:transposase